MSSRFIKKYRLWDGTLITVHESSLDSVYVTDEKGETKSLAELIKEGKATEVTE